MLICIKYPSAACLGQALHVLDEYLYSFSQTITTNQCIPGGAFKSEEQEQAGAEQAHAKLS